MKMLPRLRSERRRQLEEHRNRQLEEQRNRQLEEQQNQQQNPAPIDDEQHRHRTPPAEEAGIQQGEEPPRSVLDKIVGWIRRRRWPAFVWLLCSLSQHWYIWNVEGTHVNYFNENSLIFFSIMDVFYIAELLMYFSDQDERFRPAKLVFLYSIAMVRLMEDGTKEGCRFNTKPDFIVEYCFLLWALDSVFLAIPFIVFLYQAHYVDDFFDLSTRGEWQRSFFSPWLGYLFFHVSEHLFP